MVSRFERSSDGDGVWCGKAMVIKGCLGVEETSLIKEKRWEDRIS
jgi:hypothetical protein